MNNLVKQAFIDELTKLSSNPKKDIAKDFAIGAAGGTAGTIVRRPVDAVKTMATTEGLSGIEAAKKLYREGVIKATKKHMARETGKSLSKLKKVVGVTKRFYDGLTPAIASMAIGMGTTIATVGVLNNLYNEAEKNKQKIK